MVGGKWWQGDAADRNTRVFGTAATSLMSFFTVGSVHTAMGQGHEEGRRWVAVADSRD